MSTFGKIICGNFKWCLLEEPDFQQVTVGTAKRMGEGWELCFQWVSQKRYFNGVVKTEDVRV